MSDTQTTPASSEQGAATPESAPAKPVRTRKPRTARKQDAKRSTRTQARQFGYQLGFPIEPDAKKGAENYAYSEVTAFTAPVKRKRAWRKEICRLAGLEENRKMFAGARVRVVAICDEFPLVSTVTVATE